MVCYPKQILLCCLLNKIKNKIKTTKEENVVHCTFQWCNNTFSFMDTQTTGTKQKEEWFRLDIKKRIFPTRKEQQQKRPIREAVLSPSLEVFNA